MCVKVEGKVTSISVTQDGNNFFVGTADSCVYWGDCATLKVQILKITFMQNWNQKHVYNILVDEAFIMKL